MDTTTSAPSVTTVTSCWTNASNFFNISTTLSTSWTYLTSWTDCFESYEELKIKLSNILSSVKSSKYAGKNMTLTSEACSKLNQCCSKAAKYSKDYFEFDLQSEVTEAVGDGMSVIDKEKLEKLLSKLNKSMTKQVERMLWGELIKTAALTGKMIGDLIQTQSLIRDSTQYRESSTLRDKTTRIKENLGKADAFYRTAHDEMNRIETTPDARPTQYALGQIALNLDRAKFESDCAQRELETILRDINQKLESLSSNKRSHGVNIGLSTLNLTVTALQFASRPTFLLSNTAKLLFAANGGLQIVNTIGHSIAFFWSQEEIYKLEELQHEMKTLEAKLNDSFNKIEYGMAKLETIKQHIATVPDRTLIVQE